MYLRFLISNHSKRTPYPPTCSSYVPSASHLFSNVLRLLGPFIGFVYVVVPLLYPMFFLLMTTSYFLGLQLWSSRQYRMFYIAMSKLQARVLISKSRRSCSVLMSTMRTMPPFPLSLESLKLLARASILACLPCLGVTVRTLLISSKIEFGKK